jgi:hypothetical protein
MVCVQQSNDIIPNNRYWYAYSTVQWIVDDHGIVSYNIMWKYYLEEQIEPVDRNKWSMSGSIDIYYR